MNFDEVLNKRVSTRSFSQEKISDDLIEKLLVAGQKAPIANGQYEKTALTVIRNKKLLQEMNQEYRDYKNDQNSNSLYDAPMMIMVSSSKDNTSRFEDAGCILENIALKASELNIGSCYIRGLVNNLGKDAKYIKKLNLKEGFFPVSGIILGYSEKKLKGKDHKIEINFID